MKNISKKVIIFLFIVLPLTATLFTACENQQSSGEEGYFTIETSYCTLKYPKKWEETVKTDVLNDDTNTVHFSKDGVNVFDITFGDGDTLLGTLKKDGKSTDVYALFNDFKKDDANYNTYMAMQDDVNYITANLEKDYDFAVGKALNEDSGDVYEITTKVVTMKYPERWKEDVTAKEESDGVVFSSGDVKLFTIYFGGDKGEEIGTYKDTVIRLETYKFDKSKMTAEDYQRYSAMQEDVNVLLDALYEEKNFKAALPN